MATSYNLTEEERQYLIWRRQIMAQIAELESELASYGTFSALVSSLKSDLEQCKNYLDRIYSYTKDGISSDEFSSSIDRINNYSHQMNNSNASLDGVISDINVKMNSLREQISSLRALI